MSRKHWSTLFVIFAALCWGLSGGIGGILLEKGWDPFLVSFCRGAIGLCFVTTWLGCRPHDSGLSSPRLWFWSALAGLGVAGNFVFYFVSISEGSVAVAATLMYSAPIFVYLISFALGLEKSTTPKWVAIAMVMVGIVLLTGVYETGESGVTLLGVGAGLLAGVSYAGFIFGFKYASRYGSPRAILTIAFTVLVTVLYWPVGGKQISAVFGTSSWPLFVLLGILGAGISFVVYVNGLDDTPPAVASIVALIEPVTAALFGVLMLSESLEGPQLLGMGLILITVTGLSLSSGDG